MRRCPGLSARLREAPPECATTSGSVPSDGRSLDPDPGLVPSWLQRAEGRVICAPFPSERPLPGGSGAEVGPAQTAAQPPAGQACGTQEAREMRSHAELS